jgi:hypothetical protein
MVFPALVSRRETETIRGLTGGRLRLPWLWPRFIPRLNWRIAGCGFGLIGLLQIAAWLDGGEPRKLAEVPAAAPPPAWIEISRPPEIFHLAAPEFAGGTPSYRALRHRTGGGRQDILEFRRTSDAAPAFRLAVYRPGSETWQQQSLFVELARRAAETGEAITHLTQPASMPTKFGDFEVSELLLARGDAPPRQCLGFRFSATAPGLRIDGFACGAERPSSPTKSQLACLIDSLELATPPEEEQLMWFFAAHDTASISPCQGTASIQRPGRAAGEQTVALGLRGVDPD